MTNNVVEDTDIALKNNVMDNYHLSHGYFENDYIFKNIVPVGNV